MVVNAGFFETVYRVFAHSARHSALVRMAMQFPRKRRRVIENQTASLDSRSSKCGICLEQIKDPRLLNCLHSFCRNCINQLMLTRSSSSDDSAEGRDVDGANRRLTVRCPLCLSVCPSPMLEIGASGLLKDVTRARNEAKLKCHACEEEGGDGKATAWCGTCQLAYCNKHAMPHLLSNTGHSMSALSNQGKSVDSDVEGGDFLPVGRPSLCAHHKQPLIFHCVSCNVAVCGHCTAIGAHALHSPVVLIEDMVTEYKEKVFDKVEELKRKTFPRVMVDLLSVHTVSKAFSSRADQVREEIRAAGCRVIEAVDASIATKLQQVEDIELASAKVLVKKHDDLKVLANSVISVVDFAACLRTRRVSHEEMSALLPAVEQRVDFLSNGGVSQAGGELLACVLRKYDAPEKKDNLAAAIDSLVGEVTDCKAFGAHCVFAKPGGVEDSRVVSKGGTTAVALYANDEDGDPLPAGGDVIATEWLSGPTSPPVEVTDYNNGQYLLTFTLQEEGDYELAVFVNGTRMAETISKTCEGPPLVTFDPNACEDGITVKGDGRQASIEYNVSLRAVLGQKVMKAGVHQWMVQVSAIGNHTCLVGVADHSDDILQKEDPYTSAFFWNGFNGEVFDKTKKRPEKVGRSWKNNDVILAYLDCDSRSLRLTNLRTDDFVTFEHLPDQGLVPFFGLSGLNSQMTLLE